MVKWYFSGQKTSIIIISHGLKYLLWVYVHIHIYICVYVYIYIDHDLPVHVNCAQHHTDCIAGWWPENQAKTVKHKYIVLLSALYSQGYGCSSNIHSTHLTITVQQQQNLI